MGAKTRKDLSFTWHRVMKKLVLYKKHILRNQTPPNKCSSLWRIITAETSLRYPESRGLPEIHGFCGGSLRTSSRSDWDARGWDGKPLLRAFRKRHHQKLVLFRAWLARTYRWAGLILKSTVSETAVLSWIGEVRTKQVTGQPRDSVSSNSYDFSERKLDSETN